MPCASKEFHQFTASWGITVKTSSPEYTQSNGQSERMIQTLKQAMQKAEEEKQDLYTALLKYRNTPVSGMHPGSSPVQILMSHMLYDKLCATRSLLKPNVMLGAQHHLRARQVQEKLYQDHGTNSLLALKTSDTVHIMRGGTWEPATITQLSLP